MGYMSSETDTCAFADALSVGAIATESQHITKVVSDNLRNSHDGEVVHDNITYAKKKTITYTNGIAGVLRVKFDMRGSGNECRAFVRKNGVEIGAVQGTTSTTYVTKSQDIDFGKIKAGETIELWLSKYYSNLVYAENFRIYYDDEVLATAVAASNS